MGSELKRCPFCETKLTLSIPGDYFWHHINECHLSSHVVHHHMVEDWNQRPIEDALNKELIAGKERIAELEELLSKARSTLSIYAIWTPQRDEVIEEIEAALTTGS